MAAFDAQNPGIPLVVNALMVDIIGIIAARIADAALNLGGLIMFRMRGSCEHDDTDEDVGELHGRMLLVMKNGAE
jgi:hypothetical protein